MTTLRARPGRVAEILTLVSLSIAALAASARIGLAPQNPENGVAVIFAPWTSSQASIERATSDGSRFIRFGGFDSIVVMMPEHTDYTDRMLERGAWFVVDPKVLAACSAAISIFGTQQ
ncbi:MAG: hypothetical protein JSR72_19935 [Proteobacteria bacterium]|nr:hypothetical protein [Pseudomonadota bacterium]